MPNYRRRRVAGGTYFFTVVTKNRAPLFHKHECREALGNCLRLVRDRMPFTVDAIVLMHDHLHAIWTLPDGDTNYSIRWKRIKEEFTNWALVNGWSASPWQNLFWEHTIRDEDDFTRCLDHIHWNPVKHGYVKLPKDYPHSSFLRWVELGEYHLHWGSGDGPVDVPGAEWE